MRTIEYTYHDPLDLVWIETARRIGITIVRADSAYAAWDGAGTLTIGTPETLDVDDCLAQMIFHELCHLLVEGPQAFSMPDWGLEIFNPAHRVHELACLRLQAALADVFGLRDVLAATTTFRSYYDSLPSDPLAVVDSGDHNQSNNKNEDQEAAAIGLATIGWDRLQSSSWKEPIHGALRTTRAIGEAVRTYLSEASEACSGITGAHLMISETVNSLWSRCKTPDNSVS